MNKLLSQQNNLNEEKTKKKGKEITRFKDFFFSVLFEI